MCDIETLRLFINERLSAVAEDILSVFVRTLVDYQRQLDLLNPPVKAQPAGRSMSNTTPIILITAY